MKYALGNMLNGAGGLNPDGLALDLQFAADKTLTARKGPSPILTRGSTGTFVGSNGLIQTAASGAARFDHDPVSPFTSRGLLIEEGRTNLVLQSENHPSATWSKTGLTVASASNTDPAGAAASNLVSEDSSVGLHRIFQSTAYVSGTSYAISVFLKFAGRQFVAITHPAVAANSQAIFDIQNGSVTLQQSGITASMVQYPNGWWRCVVNGVSSITASSSHIIQGSTTGSSLTGSYTGLNGPAFYIYGSQIEAGSFPTSYIQTTTSALARSADVCSITGANFTGMYNQPEGTIFADVTPQTVDQGVLVVGVNTTTSQNSHSIYKSNATTLTVGKRWVANTNIPPTQSLISTSTDIAASRGKLIYAYRLNDMSFVANGTLIGTDNAGTMPSPTTMRIGSRDDGLQINGHLAAVRYYKKRLDNAKLQALTA